MARLRGSAGLGAAPGMMQPPVISPGPVTSATLVCTICHSVFSRVTYVKVIDFITRYHTSPLGNASTPLTC